MDDGPTLPVVSWSSEDFNFATDLDPEDPLCGGTLAFQQRFVDEIQAFFGEPSDGRKFTYYLFNLNSFDELLGDDVDGVYGDGRVYAKAIPDLHEVTHAVVDLSMGNSHPFFNEGIAEVFRDRYGGGIISGRSVEDGLQYDGIARKLPADLYGRAGHFMSYAVEMQGIEATVALLVRARPGDLPEKLHADVEEAFGLPYQVVLADYAEYPRCRQEEFRWPVAECAAGAFVAANHGVWTIDADLNCLRNDVLGPRVSEDWTLRTFEVTRTGLYTVSVSGDDGDFTFVELGHCSPGCASDKGVKIKAGESQEIPLRPGRYHLTSVGPHKKSGRLTTRIEPVLP